MTNINTARCCETCDAWARYPSTSSGGSLSGDCEAFVDASGRWVTRNMIDGAHCRLWLPSPGHQASLSSRTAQDSNDQKRIKENKMTNITTHRRCETCEWHKTVNPITDSSGKLHHMDCINAKVPERLIRFVGTHGFGCSEWSGSIEYNRERGLMTPAVSNALVEACKEFVKYIEGRKPDVDKLQLPVRAYAHASSIRDALRQQGIEV